MRAVMFILGRATWWGLWPLTWLFLGRSERTRVLLVNDRGEVLVIRGWVSSSSRWSLPGGGLHKSESPLQGALRETYEEIGVALDSNNIQYLGKCRSTSKGLRLRLHIFTAAVQGRPDLRLQWHEVALVRWVGLHELTSENADSDVLRALKLMASST